MMMTVKYLVGCPVADNLELTVNDDAMKLHVVQGQEARVWIYSLL
jgi:metal-sulfur cluster biosynthetic enzyme